MASIVATFQLPFVIGFQDEASGCTGTTVIGGERFRVLLPRVVWGNAGPEVARPAGLPAGVGYRDWGTVPGWNTTDRVVLSWWVNRLVFRQDHVDPSTISQAQPGGLGRDVLHGSPVDELFADIEGWTDRLRDWIETVADQDIRRISPIYARTGVRHGLSVWLRQGTTLSQRATETTVHAQSSNAELLDSSMWRRVLREAGKGTPVPEERRLLADARAALGRGQTRRSVIDAGTAVELVLRRLLDSRLAKVADPPRAKVLSRNWTLGALVDLFRPLLPPGDITKDLVNPRNTGVHRNTSPAEDVARKALVVATKIVESVQPLK